MIFNNVLIIASFVAVAVVMLATNWRIGIAGLASLYLIVFIIIIQIWPIALASVKLISGWMGISLISASRITVSDVNSKHQKSELLFRLLLSILVWLVIAATTPVINEWLPIPFTNLYVGLSLSTSGLIYTSLVSLSYQKIIGILIFLIGFDVIYSSLEGSALVTAVFALITILIGLLSGYFTETQAEQKNA